MFRALGTDNRGARFTASQCDCCDLRVIITVTYLKPLASGRLETRRGRLEPDNLFDRIEDAHASSDGSLAIGRCSFDSDTARARVRLQCGSLMSSWSVEDEASARLEK